MRIIAVITALGLFAAVNYQLTTRLRLINDYIIEETYSEPGNT